MNSSFATESRSFLFLEDEKQTGPNKCNQSGSFDHVMNASLPTIRLVFVIWLNAPFLLQIIEA